MKNRIQDGTKSGRISAEVTVPDETLIARFGEALLLRVGRQIVLRGGSMADRLDALEWMATAMPDEVPRLEL